MIVIVGNRPTKLQVFIIRHYKELRYLFVIKKILLLTGFLFRLRKLSDMSLFVKYNNFVSNQKFNQLFIVGPIAVLYFSA